MILQSLVKHYEKLLERGDVPTEGWSKEDANYAIELSEDGEYRGMIPLMGAEVQRGKKSFVKPRSVIVPYREEERTSNVFAYLLWDKAKYLLLSSDAEKEYEDSKEKHKEFLGKIDSPVARAICKYFTNREITTDIPEDDKGGNFVFFVNGVFAHDDDAIKQAWDTHIKQSWWSQIGKESPRCLVTGERLPIARVHPKIKGIKGAHPSGALLVSFNSKAHESFGKTQSYNAPVSKYAAFAYLTAFKHLCDDDYHHIIIDDLKVVFWAETGEPDYGKKFLTANHPTKDDDKTVAEIMSKLDKGDPIDEKGIDIKVPFYVLCISPNEGRLAVRFFLRDSFGNMLSNLREHYRRLEIVKPAEEREYLFLHLLLKETVNPNSKNQSASPLLAGSLFRSILIGAPYPVALFTSIILRVKATQGKKKINRTKAAIIKAYLLNLTNTRIDKEVLSVSLNEESTYIPYVLGRLFSVLENIQEKANSGINATIKDRYFNSACATPSFVFPLLLKLSNYHFRKMEKGENIGLSISLEKDVTALMGKIDKFPKRLTLEEQGTFVLGYYHQTQKRYESKKQENQ